MPENVLYILVGVASAATISILLFISRRLLWNEVFEVKARRLNLFDEKQVRIAISFANQTRQAFHIKDLSLCYSLEKKVYPLAELRVDPYVEAGAPGDVFHKDQNGVFIVPVSPRSRLDAIYTFTLLEEAVPKEALTMLRYIDEHNRTHYAPFSLTNRYGQLLRFKKKSYEEGKL